MQVSQALNAPNQNTWQLRPELLLSLYLHQEWDRLSQELLNLLSYFERTTYFNFDTQLEYAINSFVKNLLYFFTQPDYIISDRDSPRFIYFNGLISNLVAISSFKTTDAYLQILKNQPNNFVKILTLYSARNQIQFEIQNLFNASPQLTSLWYCHFFDIYYSLCADQNSYHHLKFHLNHLDDRIHKFINFHHMSFSATYIDPQGDRPLKEKINQVIKNTICSQIKVKNTPNKKRIAVISSNWYSKHSVYRNQRHYLEALKDDYELVLVGFGQTFEHLNQDLFQEVIHIDLINNVLDIGSIQDNTFSLVYYPDVGMNLESIILANLRLAPIQVTSYGHSVSTFGSEIDYFIGSADVEVIDKLHNNYSERVVLIPGLGITNIRPAYTLNHPELPTDKVIINCSWYSQKVNYPMLCLLKIIREQANQPIVFRFFAGGGLGQQNNFLPFVKAVQEVLEPEVIQVVPPLDYDSYMTLMEQGNFSLDSYHFGGCNTIIDSLYLAKPIVTWEGDKWYNRIGSALLRQVGLEELVVTNQQDYVALATQLIRDENYRQSLQEKIKSLDLDTLIFQPGDGQHFKRAIAHLIEHHHQLAQENSRSPIFI